jgi:hypothetical protein
LSASTGFPALTVPAGFTRNGLPVGLELLGRAWSDARLLALGFSFEQSTRHRRTPVFTPPLPSAGAGQRPPVELTATAANGTRLRALLTWDPLRGTLDHDVAIAGVSAERVFAVTIERGDEAHGRGVIHRLSGPGVLTARGIWTPLASERAELVAGELIIALYTSDYPAGALRVSVPAYR